MVNHRAWVKSLKHVKSVEVKKEKEKNVILSRKEIQFQLALNNAEPYTPKQYDKCGAA